MSSEKANKTDSGQIIFLLNEGQKLLVHARLTPGVNNSIDITAVNHDEADRPDPLRVPEVIIVICVLLLWCASIMIFIRHSELLRIRHRDLPYRSSMKPPMNLNHITVVNRTSDMVIHSKPRISSGVGLSPKRYPRTTDEYDNSETIVPSHGYLSRQERHTHSFDSNTSVPRYATHDGQLLDPYMIPSEIRRSLLELHRKSMDNVSAMRYTMSYSTNDVSRDEPNDGDQNLTVNERCVQESPV